MSLLNSFNKVFIMGIGGSGMSSIAKYLKQKGYHVEGYDQRISYITNILENDGVRTYQNYEDFIYEKDVLYIISSAVNLNNTFLKNFKNNKKLTAEVLNLIYSPKKLQKLSKNSFEIIQPISALKFIFNMSSSFTLSIFKSCLPGYSFSLIPI